MLSQLSFGMACSLSMLGSDTLEVQDTPYKKSTTGYHPPRPICLCTICRNFPGAAAYTPLAMATIGAGQHCTGDAVICSWVALRWPLLDVNLACCADLPYGWDFLVENLMDPSHVAFSHHGILGKR